MKRNKASLNDDRHSNNDSDDDNAKKPKNEDSAVNENDKVAGPLNRGTSSNPRRSSRIRQRHGNEDSNFLHMEEEASSSAGHKRSEKKKDDERGGQNEGNRKKVVTEILFSQEPHRNPPSPSTSKQGPTLQSLPDKAQEKLLACLDIKSIQELSKSCRFYNELINGRLHVSLSLPFDEELLEQLEATRNVVKKHVLRLTLNQVTKTKLTEIHELQPSEVQAEYIMKSQLAFLRTERLREIDFAPSSDIAVAGQFHGWAEEEIYKTCAFLSGITLDVLSSNPRCFMNVTKISVIMDPLAPALPSMEELCLIPNLKEFRLFTSERSGYYSSLSFKRDYIPKLQKIVSSIRCPVLRIDVASEPQIRLPKVLQSSHVKKLTIAGPCTFNAHLKMENLKEVEVYMRPPGASGDSCSYFRVKPDDRQLHRPGLCVVNLGAIYDNCPNLEKFLGHDLSALPLTTKNGSKLTFSAWKSELKKVFFEEYSRSGGTKDINSWTKSRWCFKSPLAEVEKEKERNLKKARQEM